MTGVSASDEGCVDLDVCDGIATLTLNRPRKLNALGPPLLSAFEVHLVTLDRDPDVRVVIVTGAGKRAFSVGADVNAWAALDPIDMWRVWVREGHRVLDRLASLRQPTIAAINGMAFGGGLELALATDVRLAADSALFAAPEVKIGTLPGWAGTRRLPDLIGAARAKQMVFTGGQIAAATAERWGLVNEIVPDHELLDRVSEWANAIAANAPVSVQLAKATIDARPAALEAFAGALAAGTADGQEGIAAFREKRPPRFSGR
jgi:enoyl-CoA hydratase/carnithine racemase